MPLVRIDVKEGRSPEQLRRLADVVQEVMLEVFDAPDRDRYQIITVHPAACGSASGLVGRSTSRSLIGCGGDNLSIE